MTDGDGAALKSYDGGLKEYKMGRRYRYLGEDTDTATRNVTNEAKFQDEKLRNPKDMTLKLQITTLA